MKRVTKIAMLIVSFSLVFCIQGFASTITWENAVGNHSKSILLPANELSSEDEYRTVARGEFLSGGSTQISNHQDGTIGVRIDTFAHFGVDRIFHTVFLDKWDEENEDWIMLDHWNFVKTRAEETDGELNALYTDFTVTGCEVGKYYRVRGLHGVEYNDEVEATATETNGVLLTDRY